MHALNNLTSKNEKRLRSTCHYLSSNLKEEVDCLTNFMSIVRSSLSVVQ